MIPGDTLMVPNTTEPKHITCAEHCNFRPTPLVWVSQRWTPETQDTAWVTLPRKDVPAGSRSMTQWHRKSYCFEFMHKYNLDCPREGRSKKNAYKLFQKFHSWNWIVGCVTATFHKISGSCSIKSNTAVQKREFRGKWVVREGFLENVVCRQSRIQRQWDWRTSQKGNNRIVNRTKGLNLTCQHDEESSWHSGEIEVVLVEGGHRIRGQSDVLIWTVWMSRKQWRAGEMRMVASGLTSERLHIFFLRELMLDQISPKFYRQSWDWTQLKN